MAQGLVAAMTTDIENWTTVDALGDDPSVLAALDREAICKAIRFAARKNLSHEVTARTIREELAERRTVNPKRVGAVMSGLVRSGALVDTGFVARSGDARNRNRNRRLPVYRIPDLGAVK